MSAAYGNLAQMKSLMTSAGSKRLLAKRLAENDNSKNQIYLGSSFEALNILPFGEIYEDSSEKNQILKAPLKFRWLHPDGSASVAPNAQLILYPQYPEIRMSGFLKGMKDAPNDLMTVRQAGRVLFLGIRDDGTIVAAAISPGDDLAKEFEAAVSEENEQLFYELPLKSENIDTKEILIRELRRIYGAGWINSKRLLADGSLCPCNAPQCGGYTLEAELGVKPNGYSEPDYLGWEVKQHNVTSLSKPASGGAVTLMTPEPTGGFYKQKGVDAFLRKYGYPDKAGREDRINFGGVYRIGKSVSLTGLTMVLDGYDTKANKLIDATKGLTLFDAKQNVAAVWAYTSMMKLWARKHERAVYVASEKRTSPRLQYRYSNLILLGENADFLHLLKAMAAGLVYYDPAVKIEGASSAKPKIKRRSQFRVRLKDVPPLYAKADWVDITKTN